MKKRIILLLITTLFLFPNVAYAANQTQEVCVGGKWYQIEEYGDKVEWWKINSENMANNRNSMLPSAYFEMKKDFINSNLKISQIDNYLSTYEANKNFGGNNSEFHQSNDALDDFLEEHYRTYKNNTYYQALKSQTEEARYSFKPVFLSKKCNRVNKADGSYEIFSCPTTNMIKLYNTNTFTTSAGSLKFDIPSETFKLTVRDSFQMDVDGKKEQIDFNGKLKIRVLTGDYTTRANLDDYDYNSIVKSWDQVYTLNKNSTVTLTFGRNQDVRLEFFIDPNTSLSGGDANCTGAYLGFISFSTPDYVEVDNTFKTTSNACKTFRQFGNIPDMYKEALVPECYSEKLDYFGVFKTLDETAIQTRVNEIISEFTNTSIDANKDISNLKCHYNPSGELEYATSSKTYMYDPISGSAQGYWAASCKEEVKVIFDQPKKVIAGAGFTYEAKLTVSRTCTPKLLKNIVKKPKCKYKIECWGGPSNHHGEGGAGPNEDFDDCVTLCDGGEYSKSCVNACYKEVYENTNADKTFSFMDVIDGASKLVATDENTPKLTRISHDYDIGDRTPLGSIVAGIAASHICESGYWCTSPLSGIKFVYDEGCDVNGESTMCYDVLVSDGNCSKNPDAEFESDMNSAKAEYDQLVQALRKYEQSETVEMSVIDSYLKDNNGNLKKSTWTDKVKKETSSSAGSNTIVTDVSDVKYGSRTMDVKQYKVSKSYTVNLPQAYVNSDTATVRYVKDGVGANEYERDGGNKYYTHFKSGKYNDYSLGWITGYSHDSVAKANKVTGNNIGVLFGQVGTVQGSGANGTRYTWDKINIDCFYGLYNQYNIECDNNVCDTTCNDGACDLICDNSDVCTRGIQYMFRQVNLTDLFPDRNPRWNWNYKTQVGSTQTGYISDPSKIIEDIELTGNNAYSHEPEYEFVITRGNINRIREYNDKAGSYQEYPDITCTTSGSGAKVCKSGFMTNATYVKSFRRNTTLGENTNRNG